MKRLAFALVLVFAGCSAGSGKGGGGGSGGSGGGAGSGGSGGTGGAGGTGGSGGSAGMGGTGGSGGGGGVPTGPFSVTIGPYQVGPMSETFMCATMKLPTSVDVDVTNIDAELPTGGHHLIFYKSSETTESITPTSCNSLSNLTQDTPLVIAQSKSSVLQLPTGVAYHFPAGQMVKLELHFLNLQNANQTISGTVTLTPGVSGTTYQAADIMFCGSVAQIYNPGIPAHTTTAPLSPGFFSGNATIDFTKIKVFGMTSHQHWTGKEATISKSTGASDPGTQLYDNKQWDAPPLLTFDDTHLITFAQGEGLRWQCIYDTQDASPQPSTAVNFCESAKSCEMCFIWAYYYPSVGRAIAQSDCWQ